MTRIAVLGAFDRFNYGDLLFPLLLKDGFGQLGLDVAMTTYGLVQADLRSFGGTRTRSLRDLHADHRSAPYDALVVAGGEVIGARWRNMLISVADPLTALAVRVTNKVVGSPVAESMSRLRLRTRGRWPWVLDSDDFRPPLPILYNAVGGSTNLAKVSAHDHRDLVRRLGKARYLSVRDAATAEGLGEFAATGKVHVTPDSAALLATFYPLDALAESVRDDVVALAGAFDDGYLCLQVNQRVGKRHVASLAGALEGVHEEAGLGALLLPIGRAPAHSDQVPLKGIARRARSPVTLPPGDLTIFEIMYLIAHAQVFIGTSLHGAITATAYAVPHLRFLDEVPKLRNYMETWDLPEHRTPTSPRTLVDDVRRLQSASHARRDDQRTSLAASAWNNLVAIADAVCAPPSHGP